MKTRYRYRIYPTTVQQTRLAQLFDCCCVVWNDALSQDKQSEQLPRNGDLQKKHITQAEQTEERQWLKTVSSIPLQQSIADLRVAFKNFFASLKGQCQGSKVNPPRFKTKDNRQTARFTRGGFSRKGNTVYLAKIGKLKVKWSRPLPSEPSFVTVNRKLSQTISRAGWREFWVMCEAKAERVLNREVQVISRWEPTSQCCSSCGYRWGKLDLSVRELVGLNCGILHDRDENAAKNIESVGVGQTHDAKRTGSECKTLVGGRSR